ISKASTSTSWDIAPSIPSTTTCNLTITFHVVCSPMQFHCNEICILHLCSNRSCLQKEKRPKRNSRLLQRTVSRRRTRRRQKKRRNAKRTERTQRSRRDWSSISRV